MTNIFKENNISNENTTTRKSLKSTTFYENDNQTVSGH